MHFRCVFTLLLCCVLVGLVWAKPMMHLNLHVTCSCIFMHTYLQVSIFFILYLVGSFLIVSLSLPLSISYVSCVIAPECKSIPSQNPLRFGASSSSTPSNPTTSHVRFRDEKAKSDFLENFSRHGIHSKRQVIRSNFSDTDLPTVIHNRGWESLRGVPIICPSMII